MDKSNSNSPNTGPQPAPESSSPKQGSATFTHNPYHSEGIAHTPLQKPRLAPGGSLPPSPALSGFTHPTYTGGAVANANMSTRSQSGGGLGVGPGISLSSPNATGVSPRLRFRWDPYQNSLRDEGNPENSVTSGAGGADTSAVGLGTEDSIASASGSPLALAGSSPAQGGAAGAGGQAANAAATTGSGATPRNQQQRQASSLVFHGTASSTTGSTRTAPLTVEDILANSPHLIHVSPNGSPGLVSVDKRSLSSSYQNDGRQYLLDFSQPMPRTAAAAAAASNSTGTTGSGGPLHAQSQRAYSTSSNPATSPGPIGGRPPPTSTVRIPTNAAVFGVNTPSVSAAIMSSHAALGGVDHSLPDELFADVMPSLQLPVQENSFMGSAGALGGDADADGTAAYFVSASPFSYGAHNAVIPRIFAASAGSGGGYTLSTHAVNADFTAAAIMGGGATEYSREAPADPTTAIAGGGEAGRYPEEQELLTEVTKTPSTFFGKMLPPPPPVSTLLAVCSLKSVFHHCTRYADFLTALRAGDGVSALSIPGAATAAESPPGSHKNSPQSRPRDKAKAAASAQAPGGPPVPFADLAPLPTLPDFAVNTSAELEATQKAILAWYEEAVRWWNTLHRSTPAAATAAGKATPPSQPDSKTLRGSASSRNHNASHNTSHAVLGIDIPSPSVQAAVKAVAMGTVRRGNDGNGGGGGGGGGYRGRNPQHGHNGYGNAGARGGGRGAGGSYARGSYYGANAEYSGRGGGGYSRNANNGQGSGYAGGYYRGGNSNGNGGGRGGGRGARENPWS